MRTSSAWISKLKSEALGRNYKVQDTNSRLMTNTAYRGASGCGAIDYNPITYVIQQCSIRRGIGHQQCGVAVSVHTEYDGGDPYTSGNSILYGGSSGSSGRTTLDGGIP